MKVLSRLLSIIITIILIPIQIIFWIFLFLKANFGRNVSSREEHLIYEDGIISLSTGDNLTVEETKEIYNELGSEFQFPEQTETIEHVYTLEFLSSEKLGNHEVCPRCNTETEQRLANFIYDTESEIRIMYAPSGYYCLNCPTAIIDLDLMKRGVAKNYIFNKLLGIENNQGINFFQTFNGESMVYTTEDLKTLFDTEFAAAVVKRIGNKTKTHKRKKKQSQKAARKKNRSRK